MFQPLVTEQQFVKLNGLADSVNRILQLLSNCFLAGSEQIDHVCIAVCMAGQDRHTLMSLMTY